MKRLFDKSLIELIDLIRNGSISATDLVDQVIRRINNLDRKINCYISVFEKEAYEKAEKIDKKNIDDEIGLITGIPVAVKDNICYKDHLTTCASKILENYRPPYNATALKRIIKQNGIVIGKTNMDEFAMGSSTEYSHFGPTRNPYDITKVPGGSSGGSAAAIAAGEAIIALGSDTGGNYIIN
jgi:aspartyl-tRNA(Asn)/glutamyl-tRNA(Gln) amidotransferase subunit A